jgi:hypothetical protein
LSWRAISGATGGAAVIGAEGGLHISPVDAARLAATGPAEIGIAPAAKAPDLAPLALPAPFESGAWLDVESWAAVMSFFGRSLVPSTEADRLAGAGAGLVDTD